MAGEAKTGTALHHVASLSYYKVSAQKDKDIVIVMAAGEAFSKYDVRSATTKTGMQDNTRTPVFHPYGDGSRLYFTSSKSASTTSSSPPFFSPSLGPPPAVWSLVAWLYMISASLWEA